VCVTQTRLPELTRSSDCDGSRILQTQHFNTYDYCYYYLCVTKHMKRILTLGSNLGFYKFFFNTFHYDRHKKSVTEISLKRMNRFLSTSFEGEDEILNKIRQIDYIRTLSYFCPKFLTSVKMSVKRLFLFYLTAVSMDIKYACKYSWHYSSPVRDKCPFKLI